MNSTHKIYHCKLKWGARKGFTMSERGRLCVPGATQQALLYQILKELPDQGGAYLGATNIFL